MSTYSVHEARNSLSRLIAEARSGVQVQIANRGVPTIRLVPIEAEPDDRSGAALAAYLAVNPLPSRLARSPDELDAQIEAARDAWE